MKTNSRFPVRRLGTPAILGLLLLSGRALAADTASPPAKPIDFATHDGYFASNQFEPKAAVSFVAIRDQASFDKVFGVAMVMGDKSHRLPPAAFDKNIVVAVIHRGKAMVTYQVQSVSAEAQSLVVRYTTEATPDDNAEFACPLILSLDKGGFQTVRFIENGKPVKHLTVAPPLGEHQRQDKPGPLTESTEAGLRVLSIKGGGMGHATVACDPQQKPRDIILRAYLRGLESLSIANEHDEWKVSVLSHSGHTTLLHLWQDGKEGPALTKDSPYWAEIGRMGSDGKPVAGLPPEGGWFVLRIPSALLTNARELKLRWIDFYR